MARSPRVRLHLVDPPGGKVPSIEGLLRSRRHHEYLIAIPQLLVAEGAQPIEPEGRLISVHKDRVLFFEHL